MAAEFQLNPRWFGAKVPRVEDDRLLKGRGRYVDDLPSEGALHAAFLRSPYAHAGILSIDVSGAVQAGAAAAYTAEDLGAACKEFPQPVPIPALRAHSILPLAKGVARYVGEPVAVVLAESRALAEDALEGIRVDFEILDALAHPVDALEDGAPRVHEDVENNIAITVKSGFGNVEDALANSPRRETLRLTVQRGGRRGHGDARVSRLVQRSI